MTCTPCVQMQNAPHTTSASFTCMLCNHYLKVTILSCKIYSKSIVNPTCIHIPDSDSFCVNPDVLWPPWVSRSIIRIHFCPLTSPYHVIIFVCTSSKFLPYKITHFSLNIFQPFLTLYSHTEGLNIYPGMKMALAFPQNLASLKRFFKMAEKSLWEVEVTGV